MQAEEDLWCHGFYKKIFVTEAFAELIACMKASECQEPCKAELARPVDARAKKVCGELDAHFSGSESEDLRAEWRQMRKDCPKVMALLTEHGQRGAKECLVTQCFVDGCHTDLRACALDTEEDAAEEFWDDIRLELDM